MFKTIVKARTAYAIIAASQPNLFKTRLAPLGFGFLSEVSLLKKAHLTK